MEIVKRANLKSHNDQLGMLLEIATKEAIKNIPLLIRRTSQLNKYYQQDISKGPDVIFDFDDNKKTGCIECKNLNKKHVLYPDWFRKSVDTRFFPEYANLDGYIVVISHFNPYTSEFASKIRMQYHILEVGFQLTNQETYEAAIPIIEGKLRIIIEWLKNSPQGLK